MTFRDFLGWVGTDLFGATVPANGGPQPNSGLVDDTRFPEVDLIGWLKSLGQGAIEGIQRKTAEQLAQSERVRTAVKEEAQLKIGQWLTQPAVLILGGLGLVVLLVVALRR